MPSLPPPDPRRKPIDPLLQQRLASLNARRPTASSSAPVAGAARPAPGSARPQPKAGKRVKPAKGSKAAAVALSAATTVGLATMFAHNNQTTGDTIQLTAGTVAATATTAAQATTATPAAQATAATTATTATTAATAAATVADGTYVGAASNNRFGTVQVQVVYSGGQITDVQILSYPDGDRRSISINQYALPTLIGESISAQSAQVDSVSGATYTSRSYVKSLQSAIDNAKAASGVTG